MCACVSSSFIFTSVSMECCARSGSQFPLYMLREIKDHICLVIIESLALTTLLDTK